MAVLPTTNITTSIVRSALGENNNNVGLLCRSSNINMWSKRKPVIYPANSTDGVADWWRSADNNCGIYVQKVNGLDELPELTGSVWSYIPPTGGASAPYRLGDFRNYEHNSTIPFDILLPKYIITGSSGNVVKLRVLTVGSNNLTLTDIVGNKYFGVYIKKGSTIKATTATTLVSSGENTISLDGSGMLGSNGEIVIITFLSNTKITGWQSVSEQVFYSLNADANYSFITSPIYTPLPNQYLIGKGGIANIDRTAISSSGSPVLAGGRITEATTLTRRVSKDYTLNSITASAKRYSDNVEVSSENIPIDGGTSPQLIESTQLAGESINFNCQLAAFLNGTLPQLGMDDYYIITHTFNFI